MLNFEVLEGDNQSLDLIDRQAELGNMGLSSSSRVIISRNPLIKGSVGMTEIRSD